MMLFPVLLSNLQRLSTAFEKKKNTQSAVFISILSDFNRARDVAKRPGDVCSATTEAERRPRTFEPRRGSKTRKRISIRISFSCSFESARRDSNPRPRPWQGRAPPTEPLAHIQLSASPTERFIRILMKCPVPESNQRHEDFQSSALPTELTGHKCFRIELRE